MQSESFTLLEGGYPLHRHGVPGSPVLLIGFQRQSSLGLGYLAATLRQAGYSVETFDYESDRNEILVTARRLQPILIGFSLIFQSYVIQFHALMGYLRANGIACHFTAGGHFPSLSYTNAFECLTFNTRPCRIHTSS